jgi:hypothetical protein
VNTIDIDAYCTCLQDELTSPLERYFLFFSRAVHLDHTMLIIMKLLFILVTIDMFL